MKTMKDFKGTQGEFSFFKASYSVKSGQETGQVYKIFAVDGETSLFYSKSLARVESIDTSKESHVNDFLYPNEQAEANARLFANSKRVLEAAISLVSSINCMDDKRLFADMVNKNMDEASKLGDLISKLEQAINDSL